MAEQKDEKGRSIHHLWMSEKGALAGGLKMKDNYMKDTLQRYASIVVIRCRCGSKDSVWLKGEDEYLHHTDKFFGCSSCKMKKRFDQINGLLTFTQNERYDINPAKKKTELHITK